MTDTAPAPEILLERRGPLAVVILNRPKALNALTLGMIRALAPQLAQWERDPAVKAVVMRGSGDKAFCAGGDVRAIWEAGRGFQQAGGYDPATAPDDCLPRRFFFEEYRLNRQIKLCAKPIVSLLDGVTMGGGCGLSMHGSHRVATERTLIAMPETAIGLFPDVGGSVFLNACPGEVGTYLALTGDRLKGGADALWCKLATHAAPSAAMAAIEERLAGAAWTGDPARDRAVADAAIAAHAADPGPSPLSQQSAWIDRCFAPARVEDILAALARESGAAAERAAAARKTIETRSPTSLKLTLAQLRRTRGLGFDQAMATEFRLVQRCMAGHDFFEGIRAVLVDKDQAPRWRPDRLDAVTDAMIDAYFAPLGPRELTFAD
ncbi:MAG: enoyl-CoA hydratase/isomerase family protein [Alphaproteobacteria bacterium]|nr:enoyl-CoA hydratase/isomerase family protein [Alphaproteobacteria bacterium]